MEEDPIMQELRAVRRRLLAEAGGDLGKLLERASREAPLIMEQFRKQAAVRAKERRPQVKVKRAAKTGAFRSGRGRIASK